MPSSVNDSRPMRSTSHKELLQTIAAELKAIRTLLEERAPATQQLPPGGFGAMGALPPAIGHWLPQQAPLQQRAVITAKDD